MRKREGFIIEIIRHGAYAKASAVDPETGEEVSVVGPSRGHDQLLTKLAVRKLQQKLSQA